MSWSKNVSCGIVVSPSFQPISHEEECARSEEHTSELQSQSNLVCRLLLEKKKKTKEIQSKSKLICRILLCSQTCRISVNEIKPTQRSSAVRKPSESRTRHDHALTTHCTDH